MKQKTPQNKKTRTKVIRARLTEDEYAAILKKIPNPTRGDISNHVRNLLLNREIRTEIYDSTADRVTIPLFKFVNEIKRIGVNFNQIARYIQAKHRDEEIKKLLEKAVDLMLEIGQNMSTVKEVSNQILEIYDRKNQQ